MFNRLIVMYFKGDEMTGDGWRNGDQQGGMVYTEVARECELQAGRQTGWLGSWSTGGFKHKDTNMETTMRQRSGTGNSVDLFSLMI